MSAGTIAAVPDYAASTDREQQALAEQQQAVRMLLRRPLLRADVSDEAAAFVLCRRHAEALRERLRFALGYELVIRSDHARLFKVPLRAYTDRPARIRPDRERPGPADTWAPFTRRHYTMLALILAALESAQGRRQVLISVLADEVMAVGSELSIGVDFDVRAERRAFAEALDWLCRWGVLAQRDGRSARWVAGDSDADDEQEALFDINHARLGDLKATTVPLTEITDAEQVVARNADYAASQADPRAVHRHRIARILVEEPALYDDELSDDERALLAGSRGRALQDELESLTGLAAERRAEGRALIDDQRDALTDIRFPVRSHDGQIALLLCETLAQASAGRDPRVVSGQEAVDAMSALYQEHGEHWGRERSIEQMLDHAVDLLCAMKLCARQDTRIMLRPALARYAQPTVKR